MIFIMIFRGHCGEHCLVLLDAILLDFVETPWRKEKGHLPGRSSSGIKSIIWDSNCRGRMSGVQCGGRGQDKERSEVAAGNTHTRQEQEGPLHSV